MSLKLGVTDARASRRQRCGGDDVADKAALLEHGTLNQREGGGGAMKRGKEEGGNVRVRMPNWK